MARGYRGFLSAWEGYRIEADEYRDLDEERVLALYHASGRGKTSGLEIGQMRTEGAALFHVRSGKVTTFIGYNDRNRAFADLGLSPEGDAGDGS